MQRVRFPFDSADQLKIADTVAKPLTISEAAYSANPQAGTGSVRTPYPQALQISFALANASDPAPQVRPLSAGLLRFFPSPGGTPPDPTQADATFFSTATYDTWPTVGILMLDLEPLQIPNSYVVGELGIEPNRVWYSEVKLTKAFLTETLTWVPDAANPTLRKGLVRRPLRRGGTDFDPANDTATSRPWAKNLIAAFLAGDATAKIQLGASASADDAAVFPMPIVPTSSGSGSLVIEMAVHANPPMDGMDYGRWYLAPHAPILSRGTASVYAPENGAVPARMFFQSLGAAVQDAGLGASTHVADKVASAYPNGPRYFPFQFKRWDLTSPHISAVMPTHYASVTSNDVPAFTQRLPNHGVVFARQDGTGTSAPAPSIVVALKDWFISPTAGPTVKTTAGSTLATTWPDALSENSVAINFATTSRPRLLVRPPFATEVPRNGDRAFPAAKAGEAVCSFMSLRHFTRVLIDNRIAGGRLLTRPDQSKATVEAALDSVLNPALSPAGKAALIKKIFAGPALPTSAEQVEDKQAELRDILKGLLYTPVSSDPNAWSKGQIFGLIWHSASTEWGPSGTRPQDFSSAQNVVGYGGPGAVHWAGFGTLIHSPPRVQSMTYTGDPDDSTERMQASNYTWDDAELASIVNAATEATLPIESPAGSGQFVFPIENGGVAQVWRTPKQYQWAVSGQEFTPLIGDVGAGHSMTFIRYLSRSIATDAAFLDARGQIEGQTLNTGAIFADHHGLAFGYVVNATAFGNRPVKVWKIRSGEGQGAHNFGGTFKAWFLLIAAKLVRD